MSGAANKKDKSVGRSFVDIINGNFLTKDDVLRHLPFLMFLCLLALVYIANGYMAEDTVRKLNNVIAIEKKSEINQTGSVDESCLNVMATYERPKQNIIGKI